MTKTTTMLRYILTHAHIRLLVPWHTERYSLHSTYCRCHIPSTKTHTCQKRGPFEIQICEPHATSALKYHHHEPSSYDCRCVYTLRCTFILMLVTRRDIQWRCWYGVRRRGGKVLLYTVLMHMDIPEYQKFYTENIHLKVPNRIVVLCVSRTRNWGAETGKETGKEKLQLRLVASCFLIGEEASVLIFWMEFLYYYKFISKNRIVVVLQKGS